ncbi:MAG: hypothetical protein U0V02_05600 [Anaerolineales bacterium]
MSAKLVLRDKEYEVKPHDLLDALKKAILCLSPSLRHATVK